jgi:hypothetical protein
MEPVNKGCWSLELRPEARESRDESCRGRVIVSSVVTNLCIVTELLFICMGFNDNDDPPNLYYLVNGGAHPFVSIGHGTALSLSFPKLSWDPLCMFTIMSSSPTMPPQLGFAKDDCPLLGNWACEVTVFSHLPLLEFTLVRTGNAEGDGHYRKYIRLLLQVLGVEDYSRNWQRRCQYSVLRRHEGLANSATLQWISSLYFSGVVLVNIFLSLFKLLMFFYAIRFLGPDIACLLWVFERIF